MQGVAIFFFNHHMNYFIEFSQEPCGIYKTLIAIMGKWRLSGFQLAQTGMGRAMVPASGSDPHLVFRKQFS